MRICTVAVCWAALAVLMLMLPCEIEGHVSATNPGFRTIVTQRGLDYVNKVGLPLLKDKIGNLSIPSFSMPYKAPILGTVTFTLSNIRFTSLNFGVSTLTSTAKGVSLTDGDVSLTVSADWSYREDSWPHLKDHGSVDVSGSGISLSVSVDLTMNKTTGGVHINCSQCSIGIDKLTVTFHGGKSWLYNLFSSAIEGKLKGFINDQMCSSLRDQIDTAGNSALDKLVNVTYVVGDGVEIDYSLVSDPDFSHPGIIIVDNKGEFRRVSNPQDPPFTPPPLPNPSLQNLTRMVYVQATTYVAESASWAFWKAGLMRYNVSNDKIPVEFGTTGFYCDLVSPELCKKYPDKKVMFGIMASDYPRLKVTPKQAVMTGQALASMYVDNNGREELAFTLELNAQADMTLSFNYSSSRRQYVICGNVSNPKISVSLYKSNIGNFNCSTLRNMITTLAPPLGLVYINKYINGGIPIPTAEGLTYINPALVFGEGYVEVSGDVSYSPEMLQKLKSGLF